MQLADFLGLIHPAIAVIFVFPLIGTVVNFAWQTRQRRLQTLAGGCMANTSTAFTNFSWR